MPEVPSAGSSGTSLPETGPDNTPETAHQTGQLTCWVISDGKAGDEGQCIGVAQALDAAYQLKTVAPRAPFSWWLPKGPADPREVPGARHSPFLAPWPDLAIASGRRAVRYLRLIKKASGGKTFTVCLKDPRTGPKAADLIWVPAHDPLRGPNVLVTPTSPHRFSAGRLQHLRNQPIAGIDALTAPRVAVLIGGNSRHHEFRVEDQTLLLQGLRDWIQDGNCSLMITASRRTPNALAQNLAELAQTTGQLFWDGTGENPMPAYLAKADAIVTTADSTNMIGEAAATGKPIHVFEPQGGHAKIDRFLGTLRDLGVIHPFPGPLKTTTYEPLDSTPLIAAAIKTAMPARKTTG